MKKGNEKQRKAIMANLRRRESTKAKWKQRYKAMGKPVSKTEAARLQKKRPQPGAGMDSNYTKRDAMKAGEPRSVLWRKNPKRYDLEGMDTRGSPRPDLKALSNNALIGRMAYAGRVEAKTGKASVSAAALVDEMRRRVAAGRLNQKDKDRINRLARKHGDIGPDEELDLGAGRPKSGAESRGAVSAAKGAPKKKAMAPPGHSVKRNNEEHYAGLKGWVNDYKRMCQYGNVAGAKAAKANIDKAIKKHGLDAGRVYGTDPTPSRKVEGGQGKARGKVDAVAFGRELAAADMTTSDVQGVIDAKFGFDSPESEKALRAYHEATRVRRGVK